MLTLTRTVGETIRIGDDIIVTVAEVRSGTVRISIDAPREVRILREEVHERITLANTVAAQVAANASMAVIAAAGPPRPAPEAEPTPTGTTPPENNATS